MKIDYRFGDTGGGDVAGFNDPVAANFSYDGSLTDSLIREAIQNIIDAKIPGESPVRAEFDLKHVPINTLPNTKRLEKIFRNCAQYADKKKTIPASKHYRAQADVLKEGGDIPLLRISDYNTCGLTGDHNDGRWFMFMRGVGINAGEAGAGGAFGLGKGAFFANSLFRTIFVSTITDEGAKFAGKLRLLSFEEEGRLMQGNGTFGLDGQLPIIDRDEIPENFRRTEKGTDIWIVNFLGSDDWRDSICRAVLSWFWPAIHWGILTVRVGDKEFDAQNLRERMAEFFSIDEKRASKPYNPLHFFDSYVTPGRQLKDTSIDILGNTSFYARTSDELPLPNKTALVRNTGMIIDFKGRSSPLTKFAAVFECRDDRGSSILRKLENPSHTEWDWHNWKDEYGHYIEEGKTAINEMEIFIAEGLNGLLYSPVTKSTIIPGLMEHLGLPTKEGSMSNSGDPQDQVREVVDEETGIEIGAENEENEAEPTVRTVKPIKVAKYTRTKRINPPKPPRPNPEPSPRPQFPPVPDDTGKIFKPMELENAVVRYIVGEAGQSGRSYRFVVSSNAIYAGQVVRMRLYARAEEGEGELLNIENAVGENETGIVKVNTEYCDFALNNFGKAQLSISLREPWVVAIDPDLKILI